MSSMKNAIENAAELLDVPVEALTEYVLDRDPQDRDVASQCRSVAVVAATLGMEPTELLLAVVDIVRAGDSSGCDEHRAEIDASKARAEMRETSAINEANRAGIALRALREVREVLRQIDGSANARLADINMVLSKAGY